MKATKPRSKQGRSAKTPRSTKTRPAAQRPDAPASRAAARSPIGTLCGQLESYLPPAEVAEVYRAYLFGAHAHDGQKRLSGEPYIHHPVEVARILAGMRLDPKSLMAAILHDVMEDTGVPKDRIAGEFGRDVAAMVDGVSKIGQITFESAEQEQAENFRKMLLAMSQDVRVMLIKLADRLHNMRTLAALPSPRRRAIARETLEIYAPIARRLGMHEWSLELENLGFAHLYPLRYRVLAEAMRRRHGNRKALVEKIHEAMTGQFRREGLSAELQGREKNLYSVYKKMRAKQLTFEQVFDFYAFRVVVDSVDTCYRALGVIHNLYKPVPGRFKDYIAIPKANGYQSLHTVVVGPYGVSVEIQIRTQGMHRVAEDGVAAHWLYKNVDGMPTDEGALKWLKDFLALQQQAGSPGEFLEHLKVDLFPDEVYVFTPKGDIRKLPRGATVVDFAYDVHSDVGGHCVGARVNRELVPLRTVLRNGDHVEIITSKAGRPSPTWLDYVMTGKARAQIRNFLKNQKRDEAVRFGERLLAAALKDAGGSLDTVDEAHRRAALAVLKIREWDDLLAEIGLGNRLAVVVANQLITEPRAEGEPDVPRLAIRGTEGVVVTYARCCRPIPGDPILGFISAGRGITVHTEDCPNVGKFRKHPEQWIDVRWERKVEGTFPVGLRVETKNQRGALATVAAAISDCDANISTMSVEERDAHNSAMDFTIEVRDRVHLARILRRIRSQEPVIRVARTKG
jgi:RelA/SpoT family (p)ppGpp synthetase